MLAAGQESTRGNREDMRLRGRPWVPEEARAEAAEAVTRIIKMSVELWNHPSRQAPSKQGS